MIIKYLNELLNAAELQLMIFKNTGIDNDIIRQLELLMETDATTHNLQMLEKFVNDHKHLETYQD